MGKLVYSAVNPDGSVLFTQQFLAADRLSICEFDNFKIWDLSGVDFSDSAVTPTLDPVIQIALNTIQNNTPNYQTSFDSWEFVESYGNARIENGKLIIDGKNTENGSGIIVNNHASDRYAVEFEIRILETVKNGCGFVSHNNVDPSEESWRIIDAGFSSPNGADLGYRKYPDQWIFLADIETTFDFSETNKVTLIILGDQITTFINGQLIYSVQNPLGNAIYTQRAAFSRTGCV